MDIIKKDYYDGIHAVLALSNLFSENTAAPYLNYRLAENIYCNYIPNVKNLGRLDIAIDAVLNEKVGVGIKTFIHGNGQTNQKIAEFNKDKRLYDNLIPIEKVRKIAELRNKRLKFAVDTYDLDELVYHCVTRNPDKTINFYNTPMDFIDIKSIKKVEVSDATIKFTDGKNSYSFNLSKSTLYKRFDFKVRELEHHFKADVASKPLELLLDTFKDNLISSIEPPQEDFVILPLYSFSSTKGKYVPPKSGLNQWNAAGRKRHPNEVYIGLSQKIHHYFNNKYPDAEMKFFPGRDTPFKLILPDGNGLEAKVCQDNSKAIMSNPNKDLGEWLLRKVLNLEENEILTYDTLLAIGVDSVKITRKNNDNHSDKLEYSIEFCSIGTYDEFALKNSI